MTGYAALIALAGGFCSACAYAWYRSNHPIPLPPIPKGNIILGNALEVRNASAVWLKFAEYAKQYGPIITIRIIQTYYIIVSDPCIVIELFEKRAANYSDRPIRYMINLLGWDKEIVIFLSYGPKLKYYRTLLQRALNNRVAPDYVPIQRHEVVKFLKRLVEDPSDFMENVHFMSASIAVRMAYGHKVESPNDRFVQNAEEIMRAFSDALRPGKWMVDVFPVLRHVPAWFVLAPFRRQIKAWQRLGRAYRNEPFEFVEKQILSTAEDSFTSKLLQPDDGSLVDDTTKVYISSLAASLYGAGSDTTVSIVQSFFLAMTLYPEVQAKAQDEITTFLKQRLADDPCSSRFLMPDDRQNLPYTSALVRELLRWHPVANVIPHQSGSTDDENVVSGGTTYRIPANTLVIVNAWQILHNPDVYDQPERFLPERYLVENPPPDPECYAFGFGRR
ncbi:cytochrome P450 family protein [Ceratobasidium sp. AG-Ba]|nr:cytochrome P450 family protein [Ceratobasidium sp. AG-Ba]